MVALVKLIPALLWFRVPSRAWFVVALIAPLLAGYGAQWLIDRRWRRGKLIAFAGTIAALLIGGYMILRVPTINGWSILIGGGGLGVILLLADRLRGDRLALALIAVVFADLAIIGAGWLEWRDQSSWLPPDQGQLAERLIDLGADRVYSPTYSLQQQVAEDYHLRLFGGIDPFQLSGIATAVEQGGGITASGYSVTLPPLIGMQGDDPATANQTAVPDTAILGEWGVTHVVSAYPLSESALELVDQVGGVYVYANRDPALTTDFGEVPAWASGWQDLPAAATVAALNQLTLIAALVSGVTLLLVVAPLGVALMKVRH